MPLAQRTEDAMTTPQIAQPSMAAPPAEVALLGPQTAGSLLRNIMRMYRSHFGVLMACTVLPIGPFLLPIVWLASSESQWVLLAALPYMVAAFISSGAMTIAISDICLGNRPTVKHAFQRVLGRRLWVRMLTTGLLLTLLIWLGMLALLLPGLWLMARGFLSSIVVALEGLGAKDAIRRSFALTKGQAWRIAGLTCLPLLLAYVVMVLVVMVVTIAGALTVGDAEWLGVAIALLSHALALALFTPVMGITMVLLYYDQRVRREAYDVQALAEDLMR
jgi:hypothetical protein